MAEINEYESLVESDVDSDKAELKGSLFANEGVQPDRRAEAIKLAEKMKVPVEFAEQNLDDFKKQNAQISENEYDDLVKSYPASTEFLKDTTNAGLAHDSIDELKNIESKADKSFWDETKNALVFGSMNAVKGMVDFAKMNRDEGKRDWDKLQSNLDPKLRSNFFSIYNDNDLENASKKIAESSKDYMSDDAQKSIIESAKNGDFSGATKAAYLQILQSVPQLALVAVNAEVGLASMFASETGSKYTENLAAGIDPEKAALNARITGAISTGIESIGGVGQSEILKQLIKNSTKALGKESTKQILKSAVKEIGKTAGEEGLEEFATSVSQDLLDYGMDVNPDALNGIVTRAGDAFIVGAGSGGMVGAIQSPMSVMNRYIESNKTKLNADTYEQLGDAAKDSKLRKRSPEKFMEFVEKTTKNTPFENIYIKAESLKEYFQKNNLNTEEELGKLGLLEAYEKAVDTHGELTVPAAEWITKTIDSDVYKGLKDDIRYSAEDLSVNERKKESADVKAEIQKQAAEAKQAENEGKEIIDDVYNQLVEAGVSKAEAKQQAIVYRAFNVLAQRAGISPKELYSKYGLKILGQEQMSVEQQSGYFPMPEVAQGIINLQKNENGAYDYDPDVLNQIRNSINQGELIKTQPKVDENGDVVGVLGGASTYPDFFQNKGYTKKLVLGIIDKFNSGRQLTERQIDILNDLYEGAADKINRGEYFQYAGQQSATADINKLDAAMELEKSGKSQDDIFKETGWFKGKDNRWRYEISDDKAAFKKIDVNKKKKYKLSDVLNHSDLFSAYPSLKDINVEFGAHRGLKGGHFDRATNTIKVNIQKVSILSEKQVKMRERANEIMSSPEYKKYRDVFNDVDSSAEDRQKAVADFKATGMSDELMGITMMSKAGSKTEFPKEMPKAAMSILLHEIQHSIQKEEGFARGTNKREAGGFKNYQNTLGEIEARDVENRMDLTPEERKNKTPGQLTARNPIVSWGDVKAEMPTKKGQLTLFQKTVNAITGSKNQDAKVLNQDIKGSFNPDTNTIKLFKSKDQSTFLHESAHLFLNVMNDLAVNNPTESILKDIQTIKEWVGTDDLMSVDAQEKWARGFESYLMTGETPSPALRKAFNTFKVWLTRIYKNVQGLSRAAGFDVTITPEIKGVMDRLIATEEEINSAEAELGIEPLFKDFKGLNEKDQVKYKEMLEESRIYAEAKLNKKLIDELNRKQKAEYKNKFKQNYDAIVNQLKDKPIYKAIEAMKTESGKIDPVSIELALGKEMAELIPNNLKSKSAGLDYTIIADAFGFEPTQFIVELVETPTIEQAAKAQTEELMKQEYPELFNEPEIKDEAKIAIHNEKRAELLKFELEYLEKESGFKDAIKKTVRRSPLSKEVKEQAQKYISGVKVKDIKPYLYLRAERQFAKEAGIKLAKGDIKGAFEAKRREYYNYEIYRSAVEAQENVEKTVRNYKKIFKKTEDVAKSRDVDLVNAAREILGRFGIVRGQNVDPATYLAKMKEYDPAQYDNLTNIINDASEGAADYNSVSYDKFVEVKDTVEALWSLAKETKNIQIDGKSVELTQAVADLNSQLDVHTGGAIPPKIKQDLSDIERFKVKLLGAKASLVRAEHWVDLMDLGKSDGVFRKYIWNPVSESITKYRLRKKDVINDYKKIVDEYKDIFTDKPIIAQELDGYVFKQKSHLLMALLHTGNESNKSKLLRGRGWGAVREDGSLDSSQFDSMIDRFHRDGTLTARDYEFAQKIWGLMESLKPDAQKAHKKMYGYYFNEITAREIVTPFGTYSGGYVPAKVDIYTNEDAAIREERNDLEKNNNSFQFPTTGRGFTKARVDSYAAPLSLDLNLLAGHIDGVLRFSFVEPHVKQVSRLVMNKEFRAKLGEVDPQIAREMIVPWLQRSAQQKVVLPSDTGIGKFLDGFATILRTNVAMQFMVGNVTNAAQQLTGIIVSATKIKPRHLSVAMFNYLTNYKSSLKSIYEKSAWMSANQDSNVYETQGAIEKILVNPSVFQNIKDFSKAHIYFAQSFIQNIVNSIVWMGAYNQAIENNLSEVESVRFADSAVRTTQGTTNAEDISRYEVGTATQRLFTQFAGYFNMLANLNASEVQKISKTVGLKKGMGKLFYVYITGFAAQAFLSELIIQAGRGGFDDEDDDGYIDDMLAAFFGSQVKTATAVVPYAGNIANSIIGRFNNVAYDDRLTFSPVLSVLESVSGVPSALIKDLGSEEIKKRTVKDSLMLLGVISGLPLGPIGKPVGYVMDVESGKANPSSPIDYGRGLITGQPGKN